MEKFIQHKLHSLLPDRHCIFIHTTTIYSLSRVMNETINKSFAVCKASSRAAKTTTRIIAKKELSINGSHLKERETCYMWDKKKKV